MNIESIKSRTENTDISLIECKPQENENYILWSLNKQIYYLNEVRTVQCSDVPNCIVNWEFGQVGKQFHFYFCS